MAQQIQDSLSVSDSITTPFYLGRPLQVGIQENYTETILTVPKTSYSALIMDVYLRSEQYPYAGKYALQTVHILINTPQDENIVVNPYLGQVYITSTTNASGPGAQGGPPDYNDPLFTTDSIVYSSEISGNNLLIKLTNNIRDIGVITCESIVRAFISGG
jgi:hypothetical protein